MLDVRYCEQRRKKFLEIMGNPSIPVVLSNPANLMYLAGFHVDPFSLGAGFGGILLIHPDASCVLFHDDRLPDSVLGSCATERVCVHWYDGIQPAKTQRDLALVAKFQSRFPGLYISDIPGTEMGSQIFKALGQLRRKKYPDEVAILRKCVHASLAGQEWARANIAQGMTELEVYAGVQKACTLAAGQAAIVYGDFAISPGPERKGGPPTNAILLDGDMFILDFSVVLWGYRSDFTNTLVVGKNPTIRQQQLMDLALKAMAAGENRLMDGAPCAEVYQAVMGVYENAGMGEHFPHHAGHGLGLSHPEAPFIVPGSDEVLTVGDVITLEPGLYVPGVGGLRIERNYLITDGGFENLTPHVISLV